MIVHDVEQNSDEWYALRAGKPTASEFFKLVTSKGDPSKQMPEYAMQLAAEVYAGGPVDRFEGNEWTDRGHELEDRARAWYELEFPDRVVTTVGFITDDDESYGASLDSLVQCNEHGNGALEIKCLKAKNHVKVMVFLERNKRVPADYIVQPQGQMFVAERAWCDMLFYHPELPPFIYRHRPDDKIEINLRLQIASCIDERNKILGIINDHA